MNKKYFLGIFATIGMQFFLGINSSYAVPCEDKVDAEFNYNGDYGSPEGKVWEYLWGNTHAKYTSVEDAKNKLYDTAVRYIDNRYEGNRDACVKEIKYETSGGIELIACMNQVLENNGCDPSIFKRNGTSPQRNSNKSKSNQSSSSGTSKQSKSSQKTTNNQPKQSSSTDLSKLSTDELINFINDAKKRGDQAQAYAGELQLTKDPHPEISRQAIRSVGYRLREGLGVDKNLPESLKYLTQAANLGDITAYGMLCDNFIRGVGVPENHKKAIEYCQVAAENNDVVSQANLGWLYRNSNQVPQNLVLSDQWTCKAASQGAQTAVNNVKKNSINCN